MRIIKISFAVLAVLLGLIVLTAWWYLGDEDWLKAQVEQYVTLTSGRSLSIRGPLTIDWSGDPVLAVEDIHLANPEWSLNPDLLVVERLEVSFNLSSLMSDQFKIHHLALAGVALALEENVDGLKSWEFDMPVSEPASEPDSAQGQLPFQVAHFELADLQVAHASPRRTVPLDLHITQTTIEQLQSGQLKIDLSGRAGGLPLSGQGEFGPLYPLIYGGETRHDLQINLGEIVLRSSGHLMQGVSLLGANINLQFSGPEFDWLLSRVSLPQFSHGAFDFRLNVETRENQSLIDLDGDLGSLDVIADAVLTDFEHTGDAEVTARIEGPNFGALMEALGSPGFPQLAYQFSTELNHAADRFEVRDLRLQVGDDLAEVRGQLGDWPKLQGSALELQVTGPRLALWNAALETDLLPEFPYKLSGKISRDGVVPANLDVHLELEDSHFSLRGTLGEFPKMIGADLHAEAQGAPGGALVQMLQIGELPGEELHMVAHVQRVTEFIHIRSARFTLGQNKLNIEGRLGDLPELRGSQLALEFSGPELSAWGPLTGIEGLPALPFSLHTKLSPQGQLVNLKGTRLDVGDHHFVVDGRLGEFPSMQGTELQLDIKGPDLGIFRKMSGRDDLPAVAYSLQGGLAVTLEVLQLKRLKFSLPRNKLQFDGQINRDRQAAGSEITATINLNNLAGLPGLAELEVPRDTKLEAVAVIRRTDKGWLISLRDGLLAGTRFQSEIQLDTTAETIGVQSQSSLSGSSLDQLGLVFGAKDLPDLGFDVSGGAKYQAGKLELQDFKGALGQSRFDINAALGEFPGWTDTLISLQASGPDLNELLSPQETITSALPFEISGSYLAQADLHRFDAVQIKLGQLMASANGTVGNLEDMSHSVLHLKISAPSLQPVGQPFGLTLPDQALQVTAMVTGSPSRFEVGDFKAKLGESDLAAAFTVDLASRPKVTGTVTSKLLDLRWLDAVDDPASPNASDESGPYLIPDTPFGFEHSDVIDMGLDVQLAQLRLTKLSFFEIHLKAELDQGNFKFPEISFRGARGSQIRGSAKAEKHLAGHEVQVLLSARNFKFGVGSGEGQDPETIQNGNIDASLAATGTTYRDLARTLTGSVLVVQGPGRTVNAGMGLLFGDFVQQLWNLLNPFAKSDPYTNNVCDVAAAQIEQGLVTIEPFLSQTDQMTLVANGTIDLKTEKINVTFNTKLRKGIGISASMIVNPFVKLSGTLKNPTVHLDPKGVVLSGTAAVATAGLSLLAKSLGDRYFSSKTPCQDALEKIDALEAHRSVLESTSG